MDRAFINMRNFANTWELWKQQGVNVHIIDMNLDVSTPTGKLWSGMMCLFAEWESAVKSQRTRDGLAASAALGHFAKPKLPCGTKWLRKAGKQILVPDWPARKIMRWIAYMRFIHGLSFQKIADRLEEILSKREGRRYVPEHGILSRNRIQRQHSRANVRKWSSTKDCKAIPIVRELWPELNGDEPLARTAAKAG